MSAFVSPTFRIPSSGRTPPRCAPRATALSPTSKREPSPAVKAVITRLREELPALFEDPSTADYSLYTDTVTFEDPLNKFRGVSRYASNINFLNSSPVFTDAKLTLYDVAVIGPQLSTVRTRWALQMVANLPWKPCVAFTGQSDYVVNDEGKVYEHIDYWDSLEDSAFFAPKAVVDLVSQCKPGRISPLDLGGFELLRRTAACEVRKFGIGDRQGAYLKPVDRQVVTIDSKEMSSQFLDRRVCELREALDTVDYATPASEWFLVKNTVRGRPIYEVWHLLEDANADVNE